MNSTIRLATKATLPALPVLFAALPNAEAAIIYTPDQNLTISSATDSIYFDLDQSSGGVYASTVDGAGRDFSLTFGTPNNLSSPSLNKPKVSGYSSGYESASTITGGGNYAFNFVSGTALSSGYTSSNSNLNKPVVAQVQTGDSGPPYYSPTYEWQETGARHNDANWAPGTTGYLGLQLGSGFGWAQITYGEDRSLTLHDFAYNTDGGIVIGELTAIPESSSFAAIAGLLAGSAALFLRRRRTTV